MDSSYKALSERLYDYKNDKRDIAILGGTFNPIHNGHLAMADAVFKEYKVPIVLMPNKISYYKENDVLPEDSDRLEMVRLASLEKDYLLYSDMEIVRGGITHTIDTVRFLKSVNPDRRIYFIIGGDSLEWIDKWVDAEELLASITVLTAVRGATGKNRSKDIISNIKSRMISADIRLIDMEHMDISSTDIRRKVCQGRSVSGLLPEAVEDYIIEKGLYSGEIV